MERALKPQVVYRRQHYPIWISGCMCVATVALLIYNVALIKNYSVKLGSETEKSESTLDRMKREADGGLDSPFVSPPASGGGGAVYIRWGRIECPETEAERVYNGYAAGTHYTLLGGASNTLCLPGEPIFDAHDGKATNLGAIYGAEYQFRAADSFPFSQSNSPGGNLLNDHNVPCAVCRIPERSSAVMVPARNLCYPGWTMEYKGYLVSGNKVHKARTEYICMDGEPEAEEAGYRNEEGTLFYSVDGVCGSLPCPPYIAGRELTCVVCTK